MSEDWGVGHGGCAPALPRPHCEASGQSLSPSGPSVLLGIWLPLFPKAVVSGVGFTIGGDPWCPAESQALCQEVG